MIMKLFNKLKMIMKLFNKLKMIMKLFNKLKMIFRRKLNFLLKRLNLIVLHFPFYNNTIFRFDYV